MGKGGDDLGTNKQTNGSESSNFEPFPPWAKDVRECEDHFGVSAEKGLTTDDVAKRHQIYGLNELEKPEGTSLFKLILEQFNDTLVRILLAAAVISFVLAFVDGDEGGEMAITAFVEPLVIFLILIVNAVVGIWQETNAEKALEALKEIQSQQATVTRDGVKMSSLPAKELVPGDVVELRVGDKVPADMRVVRLISSTLRVEQGSLTGESEAVSKTTKPVEENADIQGKKCMVFAGTTVVNGSCVCLVTNTGMSTEIGRVHSQIQEASQHEEDTPLKKKLNEFGEALTMIIGLICALVWLINVKYFLSWESVDGWPRNFKFSFEKCTYYFEIAVALAVAAIPEGLPAVITTCLALETLGCTTVICSDKTGTLTTNQMAVSKLVAMGSRVGTLRSFNVEGTSFDPRDGKIEDWPVGRMDTNLQMIAKIAAICNDANVEQSENQFVARGMPTEAALKVLVEKMGFPEGANKASSLANGDVLRCCRLWSELEQRIATLEFDRDRKSMGVMVDSSSGTKLLLVKGAVENVLERSTHIQLLDGSTQELDQYSRDLILQSLHDMSMSALRCLGFAYSDVPSDFATYDGSEDHPAHQQLLNPSNYSSIESNLTFVGFVGLRDPPRKEVRQAIADCRTAGISSSSTSVLSQVTNSEHSSLTITVMVIHNPIGLIITKSLYWALNIPLPLRNAEGGFHFYVAVIVAVICTPVFDLRFSSKEKNDRMRTEPGKPSGNFFQQERTTKVKERSSFVEKAQRRRDAPLPAPRKRSSLGLVAQRLLQFLYVLLSCVAVSTGPEDANETTSIFLVDEAWTLTSHYVTILPLFDFVVKVPSTHSSTVLNSLSSNVLFL
ncbi:PREDICTED: calcium-transporting ATPase 4, endoplasmic reticulum-type-like [Brassica oleracea var. oleracea]|uniref:calcium-transporting ATPase 4, endoplasmic reticulum-type-like n=1 Tax=Brassica oleracea var. oleracea TaxID=109376 RepID=UPI0006A6B846|nr:PREDICTED: calcium-transporting ATPase 4, endoplasmic reticulum-type-like [Brassica oleracea var. oleracea]